MSNIRTGKMIDTDLKERSWLELVCLTLLLVLREAVLEGEEKAKNLTAFCNDKSFWKGILKTLHGVEK